MLLVGVDAKMVFDRVDHNYMQAVLEACIDGTRAVPVSTLV